MGIFSNIKKNLKRGGVKVQLQAPASVSMQDASLPVTVTLTASDQVQVNSVRAEIIAESRNMSFSQPDGSTANDNQVTFETVARSENVEVFTLMPGESKAVQLNIIISAGAAAEQQLPEGGIAQAAAHALSGLQALSQMLNSNSYRYFLQATADVEGIALDPSAKQPLQILKPGQIGTGINIKL